MTLFKTDGHGAGLEVIGHTVRADPMSNAAAAYRGWPGGKIPGRKRAMIGSGWSIHRGCLGGCLGLAVAVAGCTGEPSADSPSFEASPFLEGVAAEAGTLFRGTFSPDSREFYFFQKVSATQEDYRIFRTTNDGSKWSPPSLQRLGNAEYSNLYPAVSPDGQVLVFSSYRPIAGAPHTANLWAAPRNGMGWGEPYLLEGPSTLVNYDSSPLFGTDGSLRFSSTSPDWSSTQKRIAAPSAGSWGQWEDDPSWEGSGALGERHHVWSRIVGPDGKLAILVVGARDMDGSVSAPDLWVSRLADGVWSEAERLGPAVNTEGSENFAVFIPDGSGLVFVRDLTRFLHIPIAVLR